MKKIGIVGYGHVGKGLEKFFEDHFEVRIFDTAQTDSKVKYASKEEMNECDLGIIAVPTPMNSDGSVNLSHVENVLIWLNTPLILIKSTIPPGTTEMFVEKFSKNIAFSPEYMGESSYVTPWWNGILDPKDMKKHHFQILGGKRETTSQILQFFKKVFGPMPQLIQTDSRTAELTKYMENSWGATKVMFCNEFARIAEAFGVDYDELRELGLLDGRIHRMHTAVFKDKRGFNGKCLPKDINGIIKASEDVGYVPELLKEVIRSNKRIIESSIDTNENRI
jgi:UDPglucose 6-dehydrogenase